MQINHASGGELEDFSLKSRVLWPKLHDESSFSLATLMPFISNLFRWKKRFSFDHNSNTRSKNKLVIHI